MTHASTTPTTQVTTATRIRCSDAARERTVALSRLPSRSGIEALSVMNVIPGNSARAPPRTATAISA
jgi:hypothetical protein